MSKDTDSLGWSNLYELPSGVSSVELTAAQKLIRDMAQAGSLEAFEGLDVHNRGFFLDIKDEYIKWQEHYMRQEFKDVSTPEECFAAFLKFKELRMYSKDVFSDLAKKMSQLISEWHPDKQGVISHFIS